MPPLIQVTDLSMSIGDLELLDRVSLFIGDGDRVGLIAVNGAGKSTLLNIIAGTELHFSGSVTVPAAVRVGYLSQQPTLDEERNAVEELLMADNPEIKAVYELVRAEMSKDESALAKASQHVDDLNAWSASARIHMILDKLEIPVLNQKIKTMSGGEKKRIALAKVLVANPDFLILDEPTNHLDLNMIEWLEEYLAEAGIPMLMVTHDRYFLDRVCNVIVELDSKTLYRYEGNYEHYLEQKEARERLEDEAVGKARNLFRTELDWLRRMPKARTHKAAFRVKRGAELEEKSRSIARPGAIKINVGESRLGTKVIVASAVSKSIGKKSLIREFSYSFARGEKVGIVGKNGTGKSTLLNLLTGNMQPDSGSLEWGETVKIGYYKQKGLLFDDDMKVIDVARQISDVVITQTGESVDVSHFLTRFLFPPQKQYDLVRKLSGGERQRLYLLTVLMNNPNFIILDEPTNDLDIITLNVLEEYLSEFAGCLIIVSHDRYFMDKIVDHIFELKGDGIITDFAGNYTQLRNYQEETRSKISQKEITLRPGGKTAATPRVTKGLSFKEKKEYEKLEKELTLLENEKREIVERLSSGLLTHDQIVDLSVSMEKVMKLIDEKETQWLELEEKKEG